MHIGDNNDKAQLAVIDALIDEFAAMLKMKAKHNHFKGRRGWDSPTWTIPEIKDALVEHVSKNDPVDVGIYAAFWWNRAQ
jgi:hypothetical protein